jgi:hypothetical protein
MSLDFGLPSDILFDSNFQYSCGNNDITYNANNFYTAYHS